MIDEAVNAAVNELIALIEGENRALEGMDVALVVASLDRKRALVERIVARSAARTGRSTLGATVGQRLAAVVKENSRLLDAAIHGQRELMKVLANAVRGAEERKVYVRRGHSAHLTRSTGLTIATSA